MPIVIAAIVIVIMSKGIPNKPIIPKIKRSDKIWNNSYVRDSYVTKQNKNIEKIPIITIPNVNI